MDPAVPSKTVFGSIGIYKNVRHCKNINVLYIYKYEWDITICEYMYIYIRISYV